MRQLKFFILSALVLLQGCAGMYFKSATPPSEPIKFALHEWPYQEYWTGIVFNEDKIGFTHLSIDKDEKKPGDFFNHLRGFHAFPFFGHRKKSKIVC